MKGLALLALLVGIAAGAFARAEGPSFSVNGEITAPNPTSKLISGVTERLNPCGVPDEDAGDLQGFDGYWITLPAAAGGRDAVLVSNAIDADVWFYDATCGLISENDDPTAFGMATDATPNETGTIPAAAAHAIVDNAAGAKVLFTFTIA